MNGLAASSKVPIYQLSVVSHDVACEIRLNDVPVLRLPGGRVESSFDVNPYVMTGLNSLSLRVRAGRGKTSFGPISSCLVKLGVKSAPSATEVTPVTELAFKVPTPMPSGFEESAGFAAGKPPMVRLTDTSAVQPFQLETPFRLWFWTLASPIEATEATRAEVLAEYRKIHELLVARDIAALQAACEEQARDWQLAYGLQDLAAGRRMLGISQMLGDPDVQVEAFPTDVLTMELLGGNKLVQLVDAEGKSPLRLSLKSDSTIGGRFNMVLCRDGAKWVVAR